MKTNVLIIGAGAVAHVVAHKCAQYNHILGDICIASRTLEKCEKIIQSIKNKKNINDSSKKIYMREIDAMRIDDVVSLIKETASTIVINVGTPYINMSVLEACIIAKVTYMDTAIHEDPFKVNEMPPWYENYEWKHKTRCAKNGINAILGVGFDPGVVNAYCAYAVKNYFDTVDTIDILDVNAGSHGKYFATNFDPEINLREFNTAWVWDDRQWQKKPVHTEKWDYDFPVVGKQTVYLSGHDELHSLAKHIDANSIRFWMGFSDHYINCFNVLKNTGLLSVHPVKLMNGVEVVPLQVVKALLPEPHSLAPNYTGKTCIGVLVRGTKDSLRKEAFIYNICDHAESYKAVEAQAISYTAGVPPVAAAILIATGIWNPKTMVNVEELDPVPFLEQLEIMGLSTNIRLS